MVLLAALFVVAQSLDLATYLMAPHLESNLVPALIGPVASFVLKTGAVITILVGSAWLAYRGRADAPVLTWAKAVLVVGAGVAFVSVGFNLVSLA
jgi:hypothetical protein